MRRRSFLAGFGVGMAIRPPSALAQRQGTPVVGILLSTENASTVGQLAGIRQGLRDFGYVEGETISIIQRSAHGDYEQLPNLAGELIAASVDLIIAQAPPAARAAKAATTTIPIVFGVGIDPVAEGLVASLARPGGNLTGVTLLSSELMTKRFEILLELIPRAERIALLFNPTVENRWRSGLEDAARSRSVRLVSLGATTAAGVDAAFMTMVREQTDGMIIGEDTFLAQRSQIADLAIRHSMPSLGLLRRYVELGGLASYGTNIVEAYRLIGANAGRILKGARPGDLAVQRPVRFEMVLNMRTARALGLTIPPLVLAQVDEVIE